MSDDLPQVIDAKGLGGTDVDVRGTAKSGIDAAAVKEAVVDLIGVDILADDLTLIVYVEALRARNPQGIVQRNIKPLRQRDIWRYDGSDLVVQGALWLARHHQHQCE
jgi:hypothetical protein